jgi:hypothetical protein
MFVSSESFKSSLRVWLRALASGGLREFQSRRSTASISLRERGMLNSL